LVLGTENLSNAGSRLGPQLKIFRLLTVDHCAAEDDDSDCNRYAHVFSILHSAAKWPLAEARER